MLDNPIMDQSGSFPVVVSVSEGGFAPGGRAAFLRIESRQIMLCPAGSGVVEVNGEPFQFTENTLLVMPWGCAVSYYADDADPCAYLGVHLIPRHREGHPITSEVAYYPRHELTGCDWRRDDPGLLAARTVATTRAESPDLADTVEYAVRQFGHGVPPDSVCRALGALMVHELTALAGPRRPARKRDLPPDLREVLAHIDKNLDSPLTASLLATVARCSEATLTRRFRSYLHASPMAWVLSRRLQLATGLLRTTDLPINVVARQCGMADPYYFARAFRQRWGMSPTSWRNTQRFL